MDEFMYYPDLNDEDFYPHIWSKKEFYDTKSPVREYHSEPKKKKELLKKICASDVLKLKNHQIFLRNFLSPETPYNSILVFHGLGTGKCILPEVPVYLNGTLVQIKDVWERYHSQNTYFDGEGEWAEPSQKIFVNSYDDRSGKIIEMPVNKLYKQKVSEKIITLTLETGQKIRLTKQHHLLTENGWSNDFTNNKFVSIPKILKNINTNSIGTDLAYVLGWQISEGHERTDQYGLYISNKDEEMLYNVKNKIIKIANENQLNVNKPNILYPSSGIPYFQLYSKDYITFLENKGYVWGKLSQNKSIPDIIMNAPLNEIIIFLRAFFDAESYVDVKNRAIELSTASPKIITQLQHLLLLLQINMSYKKTQKRATNGAKIFRDYYIGYIRSSYLRLFNEIIGYDTQYKQKNLNEICSHKINPNKCRYNVNQILKDIKKHTNLPNEVFIYKSYLHHDTEPSKETLLKIIENLEKIIQNKYQLPSRNSKSYNLDPDYLQEKITTLKFRVNSEVGLVKIIDISEEDYNEYVYDLEIEKHHNYVAGGIICHNSCAAVTITEGLKEMVEKYNSKIYVLANKLLRKNFESTLYNKSREKHEKFPGSLQCTGNTYYVRPKPRESEKQRERRYDEIKQKYSKYYVLDKGYNAFSNWVHNLEKEGEDLGEHFSNSVFVIDEAHNLIVASAKDEKEEKKALEKAEITRKTLQKIFKKAKNTKLILLTATPMTNSIEDILILVNLLRANDKRRQWNSKDLTKDKSENLVYSNLNLKAFQEFTQGYISYFRGAHPASFPEVYNENRMLRTPRFNMFGDSLPKDFPKLEGKIDLVECEMSEFQFYNHFRYLILHNKNNKKYKGVPAYFRDTRDTIKIQSSTAIYPQPKGNGIRGIYKAKFEEDKTESPFIFEKGGKRQVDKYTYPTNDEFLNVKVESDLHQAEYPKAGYEYGYPLARCSAKLYQSLYNIINNIGINFIYTRYVESGTIPICLMLEQNGFIRWHKDLSLMAGGTYRGVDNYLNIRNQKRRCICGWLYKEHNQAYKGKNDYKDPRKHKFVQATYIRADGETINEFEEARDVLNNLDNRNGENIKVIVGGKNMSEGVDFRFIRAVHIINPWHNLIQIEQTIGRAVRLCSHADLEEVSDMNVNVYKYISVPPKIKLGGKWDLGTLLEELIEDNKLILTGVNFTSPKVWSSQIEGNNAKYWLSADEFLYARALDKDLNIKQTERLLQEVSVDCYLNRLANINFPNDKDGSRECNYGPCDYQCNYKFPEKIKPNQLNTDTYSLYFIEPKIQEAQLIIGQLFNKAWALDLNSIVEVTQRIEPSLDADVIYLTLEKMLGDPPKTQPAPILDRYDRFGHLVYAHPYYVFQPDEVDNRFLPYYQRAVPSRAGKNQINLARMIDVPKIQIPTAMLQLKEPDTSLSDKIGGLSDVSPLKLREQSPVGKIDVIENDLDPAHRYTSSELAMKLDYYDQKQHHYLIRTRIEKWTKNPDPRTGQILIYFLNNWLLANSNMKYGTNGKITTLPKEGIWIYHSGLGFESYNGASWQAISEDSKLMKEIVKKAPSLKSLDREPSNNMYGLIDENKSGQKRFKIFDTLGESKNIKTKKYSEKEDLKSHFRGKICTIYNTSQLKEFCQRLKIPIPSDAKNKNLCWLLEEKLRELDKNDKSEIWFLNYFNYQRKFPEKASDDFVDQLYLLYNRARS